LAVCRPCTPMGPRQSSWSSEIQPCGEVLRFGVPDQAGTEQISVTAKVSPVYGHGSMVVAVASDALGVFCFEARCCARWLLSSAYPAAHLKKRY
jgi:hypothetical protein